MLGNVHINLQKILSTLGKVQLVAVTKYATDAQISELVTAGQTVLGESRVQVAQQKFVQYPNVQWHMIGHLQTNKVKQAVKIFEVIQSIDSLKLAREINKEAEKINKIQKILIQINIGHEVQKTGINPEEVARLVPEIKTLPNIKLLGLMAMAPYADDPEQARPYFREMKKLFDQSDLEILSMGMSGDYLVALQEGSTMVRIGSAIFE